MKVTKLCVDAGHGNRNKGDGYDPGATAGGVTEAEVVLAWALELAGQCRAAGLPVYMTRDDAQDPAPVGQRDDRAEAAGCSHMLSIHANAGGSRTSGVETFYRDQADREWAEVVHAACVAATGLPDRGVRHEGQTAVGRLAVMAFDGPCCLVEVGYLTNRHDREVMQSPDVRAEFAGRLLTALGYAAKPVPALILVGRTRIPAELQAGHVVCWVRPLAAALGASVVAEGNQVILSHPHGDHRIGVVEVRQGRALVYAADVARACAAPLRWDPEAKALRVG